jgi:hypothetical protein
MLPILSLENRKTATESMKPDNGLYIEPDKFYPGVDFKSDGNLSIWGRMSSDILSGFVQPLFNWIEHCDCETIQLEINLEYLTSSGAFMLRDLLLSAENNEKIKNIDISWYVEEDDETHYEFGELIRASLERSTFRFECLV